MKIEKKIEKEISKTGIPKPVFLNLTLGNEITNIKNKKNQLIFSQTVPTIILEVKNLIDIIINKTKKNFRMVLSFIFHYFLLS
jgi:hypothetical protein